MKWLVDAWDQNAALYAMSPVVSVLEEVCEGWLVDLFGLPEGSAAGFVGGSATANLCGIAAGRDHLLAKCGWDASSKGLFGAPELKVVVGDGAHATVFKALSILGLGGERLVPVPTDGQGRLRPDGLPALDERTLLILQAGNVNSGAFDPFAEICPRAREAGAWVHIDGAFGLWAASSPRLRHLTAGMELADLWSVDAHKTLNAPYDSGIVLCRQREALTGALQVSGSYIAPSGHRDGMHYTLDMSRRARPWNYGLPGALGRREWRNWSRTSTTRRSFSPTPWRGRVSISSTRSASTRCWSPAATPASPKGPSLWSRGRGNAGAAAPSGTASS